LTLYSVGVFVFKSLVSKTKQSPKQERHNVHFDSFSAMFLGNLKISLQQRL